ncbi:MAG: TetR/AcrR family transcriptional regulator [Solirubrobacteraceae bacterium]|nr:TetR/AcrR family transcriptional regulator [Solirubrobacteraceae bacterium]
MASARGERQPLPAITPEAAAALWTLVTDNPPATARERLLVGMAAAIEERGLAASTVADVVRHARASRRTFYEHFRDRDDCFLALYEILGLRLVRVFEEGVTEHDDWLEEMAGASRAYLVALTAFPALTRAGLAEMTAIGPRALSARRVLLQRLAEVLQRVLADGRARHADVPSRELPPEQALAVIGGLHELVLICVEDGEIGQILDLAPIAADMVYRLTVVPS